MLSIHYSISPKAVAIRIQPIGNGGQVVSGGNITR
jgi:hypothetical protein